MAKVLELCGLIHSKYKNESAFALALGWTKQRLNKITNGKTQPSLEDAIEIADGLGVNVSTIADIFLRQKSPIGDLKN